MLFPKAHVKASIVINDRISNYKEHDIHTTCGTVWDAYCFSQKQTQKWHMLCQKKHKILQNYLRCKLPQEVKYIGVRYVIMFPDFKSHFVLSNVSFFKFLRFRQKRSHV